MTAWLSENSAVLGSIASLVVIILFLVGLAKAYPSVVRWRKRRRTYVPTSVTAQYLCDLRKGQTEMAADRLTKPYIGKWVVLTRAVTDVHPPAFGAVRVSCQSHEESPSVFLRFGALRWRKRLEVIPRGARITATGRIDDINVTYLALRDCELVEDEG